MIEDIWEQVEQWLAEEAYEEAAAALEKLPLKERGYALSSLLGRLYCLLDREAEALATLEVWRQEGSDDALWHHRYGCALFGLARYAEAAEAFEQALLLDETDEDSQKWLKNCRHQLEREKIGLAIGTDCHLATQYILRYILADLLGEETILQADSVYLPRWELTIRPQTTHLTEQSAVIYLYINAKCWGGAELFECTAGMGSDTLQAIGQAMSSFLFGMWDGLQAMLNRWQSDELLTVFGGQEHRWSVYLGNIVGLGQTPHSTDIMLYWEALAGEIASRIGNQPFCYVKIYGAKDGEDVTGECRINNIRNEVLSQRVADMAALWDTEEFGSQKQFFFIQQAKETQTPYPWTKGEIMEKTQQAVARLHQLIREEQPEEWDKLLKETLDDTKLCTELSLFLPEICAENYYKTIRYPETVTFNWEDGREETVYKTQLMSYYPIYEALFSGLENGAFAGYENEVYNHLISRSAIHSVVCDAKEQGADLEKDGGSLSLIFKVDKTYEIR